MTIRKVTRKYSCTMFHREWSASYPATYHPRSWTLLKAILTVQILLETQLLPRIDDEPKKKFWTLSVKMKISCSFRIAVYLSSYFIIAFYIQEIMCLRERARTDASKRKLKESVSRLIDMKNAIVGLNWCIHMIISCRYFNCVSLCIYVSFYTHFLYKIKIIFSYMRRFSF